MVYSARKPYQKQSKKDVRFLKEGVGPESVFEKPYLQREYTEMNQAPNTRSVPPPVAGSGGLVCLYSATECEINAECYAGPGIKVEGGPKESGAGYYEPYVFKGGLIKWTIGSDLRHITLVLHPGYTQNIINVTFRDGWGNDHDEEISVTCAAASNWVLMVNFTDLDGSLGSDILIILHDSVYNTLVAVPENKIWRSQNNGASWTSEQTVGYPAYCGAYDVAHGTLIVTSGNGNYSAGNGCKIFVSSDGGDSWSQTQQFADFEDDFVQEIIYDPVNETSVAFVDATLDIAIWRSTDGGSNWTLIDTLIGAGKPRGAVFDPINSTIILAAGFIGNVTKIWISDDGGATWALKKDLKTDYDLRYIGRPVYDTTRDEIVILVQDASGNDFMWSSGDGGTNWSEAADFGDIDFIIEEQFFAYYPASNKFYVSGYNKYSLIDEVWTSTTEGATWVKEKSLGYSTDNVYFMTSLPSTGSMFVGIRTSYDKLLVWRITE